GGRLRLHLRLHLSLRSFGGEEKVLAYPSYSDRRLFTGFCTAALIACELTVSNAMTNAITLATPKIHHSKSTWYAKSCNHLSVKYQAMGIATATAISTSFKKSLDKSAVIPGTEAPMTLRIPISLVRCSAMNVASPNKPRHEIRIDNRAK